MAKEQQEGTSSDQLTAGMQQKLMEIEKTIVDISKLRKKQFYFSLCGTVLIFLIVASFLYNMYSFVRNYDRDSLLREFSSSSSIVTESREMQQLVGDLQRVFIPAYRDELSKCFTAQMPSIKRDLIKSTENIEKYVLEDMRKRVLARLTEALSRVEKNILAGQDKKLNPEKMEKVFEEANRLFIENITTRLNSRIELSLQKLALLDRSFKAFKSEAEYKQLKPTQVEEVKSLLIETMLELWIYNLNPQKGAVLAAKGELK